MEEGTCLNQLQEGLTSLKKSTDSLLKNLETKTIALKRQSDSIMLQLASLTMELQRCNGNKNNPHGESSTRVPADNAESKEGNPQLVSLAFMEMILVADYTKRTIIFHITTRTQT